MPPRAEHYPWADGGWADAAPATPWLDDWVDLATNGGRNDRRAAAAHAEIRRTAEAEADAVVKDTELVERYAALQYGGDRGSKRAEAKLRPRQSSPPLSSPSPPPSPSPSALPSPINLPFCVSTCMAFANVGDCSSRSNFKCLCQSDDYVRSVMQCWAVRCNATSYNMAISYSVAACKALGVEMKLDASGASLDVTGAPVIYSKVAFNISAVMSSLCSLLLAGALVLGFFSCRAQARKHAALGSMQTYPWMDTGKGRGRRTTEQQTVDMDASVDFYEMFAPRRPAPAASAGGVGSSAGGVLALGGSGTATPVPLGTPVGTPGAASASAGAGAVSPARSRASSARARFSNRDPIADLDFSAFDDVVSDGDGGQGVARRAASASASLGSDDKDWADKSDTKSAEDDPTETTMPVLAYLAQPDRDAYVAGYIVPDTPTTVHMAARESVPDSLAATTAAGESTTALNPHPGPYEAPPPLPPMPPPPAHTPPLPPAASPDGTPRPIRHPYNRGADRT